ncbi:hypothetical protein DPMN_037322 [Dreissena polymorpha]|uniref:Uncharacterized protein n=1 Tax=Dreissena polymorpha TaxID=45954 RepID=A0A9D4RM82_DREPO|nr:hypothetical protein DPMN_037322 [Dreissena polymorpha]
MTAVVLCGPVCPSTLNPTLIRTQTRPLAISAQLLEPQGAASLNLGFQTFLPKGPDYLIHKRLILTSSGPERNVPNYNLAPTSQ